MKRHRLFSMFFYRHILLLLALSVGCESSPPRDNFAPAPQPPPPSASFPGGHHTSSIQIPGSGNVKVRDCEPISIDLCRNMGYNYTGMPNLVPQESQADAELQLSTFTPLIQYGCSKKLTFFLCTVYAPMCTEKVADPIGPCRSLCESVKTRCEPILNEFGFAWPVALNCNKFPPTNNDQHMCMEPEDIGEIEHPVISTVQHPISHLRASSPSVPVSVDATDCRGFHNPENYVFVNRTQRCALRCGRDAAFRSPEKYFADVWMSVWSGVCFVSTLFAVLTFLVASSSFRYPERSVVIVAFCYNICSIAYIARMIAGREAIACRSTAAGSEASSGDVKIIVQEGLDNTDCTFVFLLVYYFWMAGFVWWILLTFVWFLTASGESSRWTNESVYRYSTVFHLVAWSIPAVKTVIILVMRAVDADELTGLCFVGTHDRMTTIGFIIAPLCVYVTVGTSLLVAGCIRLYRARSHSRVPLTSELVDGGKDEIPTHQPNSLTVRVGIFSLVYVLSTACVLACYWYEYANRSSWYEQHHHREPVVSILMLKIFMMLVVGSASGLWMWNSKTIQAWRNFARRLCRCKTGSETVKTVGGGGKPQPPSAIFQPTTIPLAQQRGTGHARILPPTPAQQQQPLMMAQDHLHHHHHHNHKHFHTLQGANGSGQKSRSPYTNTTIL